MSRKAVHYEQEEKPNDDLPQINSAEAIPQNQLFHAQHQHSQQPALGLIQQQMRDAVPNPDNRLSFLKADPHRLGLRHKLRDYGHLSFRKADQGMQDQHLGHLRQEQHKDV